MLLAVVIALCAARQTTAQSSGNGLDDVLANDGLYFTTNFGQPVFSENASLTVGDRGPVLLQDYQVLEKLASLNRERLPERVVHAKGAVTEGHFVLMDNISDLTYAYILSSIGKRTDVIVRFSIVAAFVGSPEWIRDPRGMAVKFYAGSPQGGPKQGCIWDLVGNNFPVFFIRDGAQFPDLIHASKPSPVNRLSPTWRFADFFSWPPESMNVLTYLFDNVGIPADHRHMNGSGVHSFSLINAAGDITFAPVRQYPTDNSTNGLAPPVRTIIAKTGNFVQAGVRYRSFNSARQGRDVARVASVLSDPMNTPGILSCWMANLKQVDPSLPTLVTNAIPAARQSMGPTVSAKSEP